MLIKKLMLCSAVLVTLLSSCQSGSDPGTKQTSGLPANVHKVVVKEVLQTTSYTYLLGKEDAVEQWVAVPYMEAKAGDTYYYEGGLKMTKFQSKELNRVFETVLFLGKVSTDPNNLNEPAPAMVKDTNTGMGQAGEMASSTGGGTADAEYKRSITPVEKKEVKIAPASGGVTIAEVFSKKASFSGKMVKIKGEVTKFTPAVMNKNWIHIQDGSDYKGKFDLVVTTTQEVKVGDKVTFEGKIGLDKDLGYGYFFDVLLEDAVIKQ